MRMLGTDGSSLDEKTRGWLYMMIPIYYVKKTKVQILYCKVVLAALVPKILQVRSGVPR